VGAQVGGPSEVVLGGRKVQIRRPRVRSASAEVALPTFEAFADTDPLNRRVVEQMLLGVATRQYGRSLEPVGAEVRVRGTSKSTVSRRFFAKTAAQPGEAVGSLSRATGGRQDTSIAASDGSLSWTANADGSYALTSIDVGFAGTTDRLTTSSLTLRACKP